MTSDIVAGVFLERNRATTLFAAVDWVSTESANDYWPHIIPDAVETIEWDRRNTTEAQDTVYELGERIWNSRQDISAVSVACYGPFESLRKQDKEKAPGRYAKTSAEFSHMPLNGLCLYDAFVLRHNDQQTSTTTYDFHTDANALALGEAFLRRNSAEQVLLYIAVTEGIGIGIVQGRDIFQSNNHPEFGLLPVRDHPDGDVIKDAIKNGSLFLDQGRRRSYSGSVGFLACHNATRARYLEVTKIDPEDLTQRAKMLNVDINNLIDDEIIQNFEVTKNIWDLRAYYLAQGCYAVDSILGPHKIVVGTDLDCFRQQRGRIQDRIKDAFETVFLKRKDAHQPVLVRNSIDELIHEPFPHKLNSVDGEPIGLLSGTGAIGMCVNAALRCR